MVVRVMPLFVVWLQIAVPVQVVPPSRRWPLHCWHASRDGPGAVTWSLICAHWGEEAGGQMGGMFGGWDTATRVMAEARGRASSSLCVAAR